MITPETFAAAPELAVLAMLDENLRITRDALLAAQPSLLGEPPSWRATDDLRAARQLLRRATLLEHAVARYRRSVLCTLRDELDDNDDLPF